MFENLVKLLKNGKDTGSERRKIPFKGFFSGLAVLAALFVTAIVAAANNYSLLAWVIVVVMALWLMITVVALIFLVKFISLSYSGAGSSHEEHVCPGFAHCSGASSKPTDLKTVINREKLAHSFEVIRAQSLAALEYSGKDTGKVRQAVQLINDTANYGEELIER